METENFTSQIFVNANNPWGMKNPNATGGQTGFSIPVPGGRKTTAMPGGYMIAGVKRSVTYKPNKVIETITGGLFSREVERKNIPGERVESQQIINPVIWARYKTLQDAANDIILYMDNLNYPQAAPTLENFIRVMGQKGYYGNESPDSYYKKVEAWKER